MLNLEQQGQGVFKELFQKLVFDYAQLAMEITGLVALLAFGYYATRLVTSFRTGILEKGWKQVTLGAIILVAAQFLFLSSSVIPAAGAPLIDYAGAAMRLAGVIFLTIGLRAHYEVWRLDKKRLPGRQTGPLESSQTA